MMNETMTRRSFVTGLAAATAGAAGASALAPMLAKASENGMPDAWDYEYDIVVCGAGGGGLVAALKANEAGCKVLCIDANYDTGGHACVSGGITHSGGGTSLQKEQGIDDSPNRYYLDHTDPGCLDGRFNDRAIIRECADRMAECFDWMLTKGLVVTSMLTQSKHYSEGGVSCDTAARDATCDATGYTNIYDGLPNAGLPSGIGLTRPLEETARAEGVDFMMNRHMDALIQDEAGRVVGIRAGYTPRELPDGTRLVGLHADQDIDETREEITVKAARAVILATGGSTGNVAFRTMFDPRWTQEYDGVAGEPYSFQDASGEIAGMAIGAALGATANQTVQQRSPICANKNIGTRYGYQNLRWGPESPIFPLCGATGLLCTDFDGVIHVNLLGKRFFDEDASCNQGNGERQYDYFAAAMGSVVLDEDTEKARRVGGPIWAIFDAATAEAQGWNLDYPDVDRENGYFFEADTIEDLGKAIVNKYFEDYPMDPAVLAETVARYNEMVDAGEDADFGKAADYMTKKIETGPFYAAWSTPIIHDTLTGLRTDAHRQVLRVDGTPIDGLFACGECAGGHHTHGMGKVQTAGYIAGMYAAQA